MKVSMGGEIDNSSKSQRANCSSKFKGESPRLLFSICVLLRHGTCCLERSDFLFTLFPIALFLFKAAFKTLNLTGSLLQCNILRDNTRMNLSTFSQKVISLIAH